MITSADLRQKFFDFFIRRGHVKWPAALLATDDPSVLFTTAGMQQFKNWYQNPDQAETAKVVTAQSCLRTSDIEEVGDNSHLTLFEMLGNFSFGYPQKEGSYFKKKAIELAWEFLTEVLKIDRTRLSATYFDQSKAKSGITIIVNTDLESRKILRQLNGLNKIIPQGDDNFWSLGTIDSPGGPTVEFYVDEIEVWNLVFNDAIFKGDHWHWNGVMKGVDTGMGLERLAAIMQGKSDVYETDLFAPIISKIEEISSKKYSDNQKAFRIITDHLKAAVFAINDGILPSNKERGYIIRRLIRRAIVKAQQIGIEKEFVKEIAQKVSEIYRGVYKFDDNVIKELMKEEEKFRTTLSIGLKQLEKETTNSLNGKKLFDLYQTAGFPLELSLELAKQKNIPVGDQAVSDFQNEMKKHQELSRSASAGMFKGGLASGGEVETKYHTATHLLLAALREILGPEICQKGSNITAERLRFDFNYPQKLTDEQLRQIEDLVNTKINDKIPVEMIELPKDEALKTVKVSFNPIKYGEIVKVYKINDFSSELCGGPHVKNTAELGKFKIIREESSSAGIRRIKAVLE